MTLWVQPLFGELIELPFSPPMTHWRAVYRYLHYHHFPKYRIYQLRLYRGESPDLSRTEEGEVLRLLITDPMAERWVSEYSMTSKEDSAVYHHSTMTWFDARWGNPYEHPSIQYRTPLTLHLVVRDQGTGQEPIRTFHVERQFKACSYGAHSKWYPTIYEACMAFREELHGQGEEICTESTVENIIHLWDLYHGTDQHLWDQGRYYDY